MGSEGGMETTFLTVALFAASSHFLSDPCGLEAFWGAVCRDVCPEVQLLDLGDSSFGFWGIATCLPQWL